jgi:hypothetical protein
VRAASHFFPPIAEKKAPCTKPGHESGIAGDIAAMAGCATAWPAWHAGRVRRYWRDAKLRRDVAGRVLIFLPIGINAEGLAFGYAFQNQIWIYCTCNKRTNEKVAKAAERHEAKLMGRALAAE